MAQLPIDQAIARFRANDERLDKFVNGSLTENYVTSTGVQVPSISKFVNTKDLAITASLEPVTINANGNRAEIDSPTKTTLAIGVAGDLPLTIHNGNVGVNLTNGSNPLYPLDIEGTTRATTLTFNDGDRPSTIDPHIYSKNLDIIFSTGNADTLTIGTSGTVNLRGGVTGVAGVGIVFPATQQPCNNPNTLDDYEEGVFTPTVTGTTSAGTAIYTLQNGRYTKIGNRVFFTLGCIFTSHTGTGSLRISGMPYIAGNFSTWPDIHNVLTNNITYTGTLGCYSRAGSAQLEFAQYASGSNQIQLPIESDGSIYVSGSFQV